MTTLVIQPQHAIYNNPAVQDAAQDIKQRPADTSGELANRAAQINQEVAGIGAADALRMPDKARAMSTGQLAQRAGEGDPAEDLAKLIAGKTEMKKFEVGNLSTSNIAALFAVILQALQSNKTADRHNQSDMALVKGQMADGVANAMRASGQAALSGAITQAAFSTAIAGAGASLQGKAIKNERYAINNNLKQVQQAKTDLAMNKLNGAKGTVASPAVPAMSPRPKLATTDGRNFAVKEHSPNVTSAQNAHIKRETEIKAQTRIDKEENDYKNLMAKAEATKMKGVLISQMAHPTTGIVGGNTQVIQANENAQQHMLQQAGQVADGLADTSNTNARDHENLLQTLQQKLAEIQKGHLDTANMIAGKSV